MSRVTDAFRVFTGRKQVAGADFIVAPGENASYVSVDQWTAEFTLKAAVEANDLVAAAIGYWQSELSQLPLVAWDGPANQPDSNPLYDHPFSIAFDQPNVHNSQSQFWATVVGELAHAEEGAFTVGILNIAQSSLAAIWAKSGDEVRVRKSATTFIDGFDLKIGNQWQAAGALRPVAWVRIPGPSAKHQWTSYPPLKAARDAIREDTDMGRWLKYTLKNMGRLSKLVGVDDPNLTREIVEELQAVLNQRYGGYRNAGKIGVVGGKVTMHDLQMKLSELDFGAIKDRMELAVSRAFGIPADMLQLLVAVSSGDGLSGGDKYRELKRIFWDLRGKSLAKLIAGSMATTYGPLYGLDPKNIGFDFSVVGALQDDVDKQYERATKAEPYTTTNERRAMIGLEPVKDAGADEITTLRVLQSITTPPPSDDGDKSAEFKHADYRKMLQMQWREAKATGAEEDFAETAVRVFHAEAKRVTAAVAASANYVEATDAALAAVQAQGWVEAYNGKVLALMVGSGTRELTTAGAGLGNIATRALDATAERTLKLAGEVTSTTIGQIETVIDVGIAEGWSTDRIAAEMVDNTKLGPYYTKTVGQRSKTIARTETVGAVERGALEGAREAESQGFTVTKEWITANDDKVRMLHTESELQGPIPLDEDFVIGAPAPGMTGDPAEDINCRCDVLYNYR